VAEIENGVFEFAKRFPHSNKKDYFTMLEGRTVRKDPAEVLFGDYAAKWWEEMKPGMSVSQIRDYTTILKTPESNRRLEIRPSMRQILEAQRRETAPFQSEYVFLNTKGLPCVQDSLRWLWVKAMGKSGLPFRRMYETRHTFASWALSKGETPEWVARTLGHVDTSMVFRTYSRYIPNMTRRDGSALEGLFTESINKKNGDPEIDTICDTMPEIRTANSI